MVGAHEKIYMSSGTHVITFDRLYVEPSVRSRRRSSSHGVDCAGAGDGSCHSGCRDCNRRTAVDALAIAGTAGLLEPVKARENAREHITAAAERGARERARQ